MEISGEYGRPDEIIDLAVNQVGRSKLPLQRGLAVARRRAPIPGEQIVLDALANALGPRLTAPARALRRNAQRQVDRTPREGGRSGGPTSSSRSASRTAAGAVERGVEEHLDGLVLALRVVGGGDRARVAEQRSHVADVGSGVQTLVGERL